MLLIDKYVLPSSEQWEIIIEGMRNPMNSWDKIDSDFGEDFAIGSNDLRLMNNLNSAGSDHRKFKRMIPVYVTITAPLYWWKEFDTYKVGTVANSCSTMHKIHAKPFCLDDFSYNHLAPIYIDTLNELINVLNITRNAYIETQNKNLWYTLIQLLPSSYNQKRTVLLNYEVLTNIFHSRRNHKLTEWHTFCKFIETLPYSELITGAKTQCITSNS